MPRVSQGRTRKVCFLKVCDVSEVGERPAAIHPGFQGTCRSLLYEVREVTVIFINIKDLTFAEKVKAYGKDQE